MWTQQCTCVQAGMRQTIIKYCQTSEKETVISDRKMVFFM